MNRCPACWLAYSRPGPLARRPDSSLRFHLPPIEMALALVDLGPAGLWKRSKSEQTFLSELSFHVSLRNLRSLPLETQDHGVVSFIPGKPEVRAFEDNLKTNCPWNRGAFSGNTRSIALRFGRGSVMTFRFEGISGAVAKFYLTGGTNVRVIDSDWGNWPALLRRCSRNLLGQGRPGRIDRGVLPAPAEGLNELDRGEQALFRHLIGDPLIIQQIFFGRDHLQVIG